MNFGTLLKRHPNDWDVSRKVFIGGLRGDGGTKDRFDIEFHFSEVGKVTDVWISQKYGFAYVEMEDQKTALKAIKELNGSFMCGGTVTVEMAKRDDQKRKQRELDLNMRWGDSKDGKDGRDRVRDRGRSRSRSEERRSWKGERDKEDRERRSRSWKDESEKEKFKERKRAPTVKDDFESWYNLESLGESSQSTRSQEEQKSFGEERRRGRSRSKGRDWLQRREERSRSRERKRSRSKERRQNWNKEKSRRRSHSRDGRWHRDQRSRSRERWRGDMSRSEDRRRGEAQRESESEDELGVEGASGERTPSPTSCARLPPHLLGGWTVLPD